MTGRTEAPRSLAKGRGVRRRFRDPWLDRGGEGVEPAEAREGETEVAHQRGAELDFGGKWTKLWIQSQSKFCAGMLIRAGKAQSADLVPRTRSAGTNVWLLLAQNSQKPIVTGRDCRWNSFRLSTCATDINTRTYLLLLLLKRASFRSSRLTIAQNISTQVPNENTLKRKSFLSTWRLQECYIIHLSADND